MADLDPKATPSLATSADPDVITGGGGGTTAGNAGDDLNLNIDLAVPIAKGQAAVVPMTVVYAPTPKQLGAQVNILLWFHGWKAELNKTVNLKGYSAGDYLQRPRVQVPRLHPQDLQAELPSGVSNAGRQVGSRAAEQANPGRSLPSASPQRRAGEYEFQGDGHRQDRAGCALRWRCDHEYDGRVRRDLRQGARDLVCRLHLWQRPRLQDVGRETRPYPRQTLGFLDR